MVYRLLDVETEWPLIEKEFTSRDLPLPDPRFAMIMGAFDDHNTLQGFLVSQLQIHFEPLVLYNPAVLRGLIRGLEEVHKDMLGAIRYFAFASTGQIQALCSAMGMEEVPMPLYVKQL